MELEPELKIKSWGAGAMKPFLGGAGDRAGKNTLNTAPRSRELVQGNWEPGLFRARAGKRIL